MKAGSSGRSSKWLPDATGVTAFVSGAYFFLTTFVFVIGLRNFFPRELRTRIPFVYFPTDRSGWNVFLHVWGRMLLWFIGAVTAIFLFALVPSGSQK